MNHKSFLTAYFVTLIISVCSLVLLSWLLVQALDKNSQQSSQYNLLTSQLKVAQEAVKRFEKRQESQADQQVQYDDLEEKYLKMLTVDQKLESENISQRSKIKELSEFYVKYEEVLKTKLKEQRDLLTREHAGRVRKLKMMFKREKSERLKTYEEQKVALTSELQAREAAESEKKFQDLLSVKLKEQRDTLTREQAKRVRELKQSLKNNAASTLPPASDQEVATVKFQLDDIRAENLRLKESLKEAQLKNDRMATKNTTLPEYQKNEATVKKSTQDQVQQLKNENAISHYNLGVVHLRSRNYDEALREFKHSLKLNPNDPLTHYNLAYIHESYLKDFEGAIRHYQDYLRLNPRAKDVSQVENQLLRLKIRDEVGVESVLKVGK